MRNTFTGTAAWKHIIRIGDIQSNYELPWAERRDEIVKRVRASDAIKDGEMGKELSLFIDELSGAEDWDDAEWIMDAIYDLADYGKWLWIGP